MSFERFYKEVVEKIVGHLYEEEARLLWELAEKNLGPRSTIVEVGCDLGRSSTIWAMQAHLNGHSLTLVDKFVMSYNSEELLRANLQRFNFTEYELLNMDSLEAAKLAKKRGVEIDLIFIDADHSMPGIQLDCEAWLPLVKKGGIAIFHDYNNPMFPGVTEQVDKHTKGWEVIGDAPLTHALRRPLE